MSDFRRFIISRTALVSDVISAIDAGGEGIALVAEDRKLITTITDGDVRRALIVGVGLDGTVSDLIEKGKMPPHDTGPLTASIDTLPGEQLRLMNEHGLRHLPLIDDQGNLTDLALLRELTSEPASNINALVMAGGFGTRIAPLTDLTPKPMLRVGEKPLIERTVEQLGQAGIKQVNIAVHYLPDKIRDHLGDGKRFGVELSYVPEDEPLGTAGALRFVESGDDPILVINGDILTSVDFQTMLNYHREHQADLTVAVRRYEVPVPFGVVETTGATVTGLEEKPTLDVLVNAGIYLLEPSMLDQIPAEKRFDMTDFVSLLLANEASVVAFLVTEYWLDIGQLADYEKAQLDHQEGAIDR